MRSAAAGAGISRLDRRPCLMGFPRPLTPLLPHRNVDGAAALRIDLATDVIGRHAAPHQGRLALGEGR